YKIELFLIFLLLIGTMAKVIGVGGIFFKFKNPKEMRHWYSEVLGMTTNDYGVLFQFNLPESKPGFLQLGTFEQDSDYFGAASQTAMINLRVDNMEELLLQLKAQNVTIVNNIETYEYGKFLHIEDPEGNRIELWEPIDQAFSKEPFTPMN